MESNGKEMQVPSKKNWMRSTNVSVAKLKEVGPKIYNMDIADTRQLKVNARLGQVSDFNKTACTNNTASISELLKRQNERQRVKFSRPASAKVAMQSVPVKVRQRPQSAKEFGTAPKNESPRNLGVKGTHRALGERPEGGIKICTGVGWVSGCIDEALEVTTKDFTEALLNVSASQLDASVRSGLPGAPPPPRGSPDFCEMLNSRNKQGNKLTNLVDDLLDLRIPREPIHIQMPCVDEDDGETYTLSPKHQQKQRPKSNLRSHFNDSDPWQSVDETDDEEILIERVPPATKRLLSHRRVTFNDEQNETTLITPRDKKTVYNGIPKIYCGREELIQLRSKTDSRKAFSGQKDESLPKGAAADSASASESSGALTMGLLLNDEGKFLPKHTKHKKPHRSHLLDDIETMVSKVPFDEDERFEAFSNSFNKPLWATPGLLTTKVVSRSEKNYYIQALEAKLANNRTQQDIQPRAENKKVKTIKTFEFGDGELIEHKTTSEVDNFQHQKKDYVVPEEARPQSASKNRCSESGTKNTESKSIIVNDVKTKEVDSNKLASNTDQIKKDSEILMRKVNGLASNVDQILKESLTDDLVSDKITLNAHQKVTNTVKQETVGDRFTSDNQVVKQIPTQRTDPDKISMQSHLEEAKINLIKKELKKGSLADESLRNKKTKNIEAKSIYAQFQNVKIKRAASAPTQRTSPKISQMLVNSPYNKSLRPFSASVVTDMKKRPTSAYPHPKLRCREIQRVKAAAKLVKKGLLGKPIPHDTEKYYANYTKPPPPKPIVPVLRKKKATALAAEAAAAASASAHGEKDYKDQAVVHIWTRQADYEVETEGIADCKKIQDHLLEEGVPVTLDTLTRALLPPGECALLRTPYVTSTNPTLPEDTSRLLSKPSIWFPEEFNRLQRARKLAQRAEATVKDADWDRVYLTSGMSVSSTDKRKTKKKKKKKKKKEIDSRSSSGI